VSAEPAALTEVTSAPAAAAPATYRITRSRRPIRLSALLLLFAVVLLSALPYLAGAGLVSTLINLFILLTMSSMWNLLAGYAGMVSVGQQAFIGAGAYLTLICAQWGLNPFLAIPVSVLATAVVAFPVSLLLLRLRGGYFAIATWVMADVFQLVISRFPTLGGGTGTGLPGLRDYSPQVLLALTYWAALAVLVVSLGGTYLLLRGRLGLVLQAMRDDELAARAVGGRVRRARRVVYLVAAAGCGAAGAIVIISQLNVQPAAAFSIGWTAQMIFVTVIGGIGTLEGPIVGTVIFYALQQTLSDQGAWYLVLLGVVAIVIAIWWPRGIWGTVAERLGLRLFPVGYWVTWLRPSSVAGAIAAHGRKGPDPSQPVSG
jgi:branched-chain amino acid transport system permease protein